ncbi:MAG: hypothetical protein WC989_04485 [Micavibrio sp.]
MVTVNEEYARQTMDGGIAAIGGAVNAIGTVADRAFTAFDKSGLSSLGGVFSLAVNPVRSIQGVYQMATLAKESPLDFAATVKPELKDLVTAIGKDNPLEQAINDAMEKDPTFKAGLIRMSSSEGGSALLSTLGDSLKDETIRANLALGIQNLAERDDIQFEHLEETVNSLAEYDITDPKSKNRVVDAFKSMGLTENDANETLDAGQQLFWKNILNEPERLGGWVGSLFQKMGFPEGFAETIAAALPKVIETLGNLPTILSNWMGPEWQEYKDNTIAPIASELRDAGRANIASYDSTFGMN